MLYRQVIHPTLISKEEHIDELMEKWKEQGYHLGVKYTKVAAQKLTKTVIETAIAGGGGLVETLRHSYSMNDLRRVPHSDENPYYSYYRESDADQRIMPRSWHEGSRHQQLEEEGDDDQIQIRQVRGRRRRAQTGSLLALTNESDSNEYASDTSDTYRKRGTSTRQKAYTSSSSLSRTGTVYATLPRKTRSTRPIGGDNQPALKTQLVNKGSMITRENEKGKSVRPISVSPVKKMTKRPLKNTMESKKELNLKNEVKGKVRQGKITKKEPIKENKLHEPEDPDDLKGETFDMTDITDERKDSKGKCEIS